MSIVGCEYGHHDCTNLNDRCHSCINAFYYKEPKQRSYGLKKNINPDTKRQGSNSEVINHNANKRMLDAATSGTPNSGAGSVKGDEQIKGLISIMEEVKTTTTKNINKEPGKETFTLQRSWMDKLEAEAKAENMEFNYLKFSFKEHDDKFYIVCNANTIMDMVTTMVYDRKKLKNLVLETDVLKKSWRHSETETMMLKAEIDLLKSQLALKDFDNTD